MPSNMHNIVNFRADHLPRFYLAQTSLRDRTAVLQTSGSDSCQRVPVVNSATRKSTRAECASLRCLRKVLS